MSIFSTYFLEIPFIFQSQWMLFHWNTIHFSELVDVISPKPFIFQSRWMLSGIPLILQSQWMSIFSVISLKYRFRVSGSYFPKYRLFFKVMVIFRYFSEIPFRISRCYFPKYRLFFRVSGWQFPRNTGYFSESVDVNISRLFSRNTVYISESVDIIFPKYHLFFRASECYFPKYRLFFSQCQFISLKYIFQMTLKNKRYFRK